MPIHQLRNHLRVITILLCLLSVNAIVWAQTSSPIQLGQNTLGELSADAPTAAFALAASGGETVSVQVLAVASGLAPRFRVLNPAGVEILLIPNPAGLSSVEGNASFPDAGTYTIEVSGENAALGQFLISLRAGTPFPEAIELTIDQLHSGTVDMDTPLALYHFVTLPADPITLTILSETLDTGMLISLYDKNADKTIATSDASLSGIAYRLLPGEKSYRVEIRAGDAGTAYTLCLGTCAEGFLDSLSPQAAVNTTPEVVALSCAVASATGGTVNVRASAGTQFTLIGSLAAGQSYPVLGRLANGSWLQVVLPNGQQGWVAASVTRLEGDCAALPVVAAPANAALAPTQPPAPPLLPPTVASSGSGSVPPAAPSATLAPIADPLPDLFISAISTSIINAYTEVEIHFTITNRGEAGTGGPFSVMVCGHSNYDGTNLEDCGYGSVRALAAGETYSSYIIARYTGVTYCAVVADPHNVIVESREDNNYNATICSNN